MTGEEVKYLQRHRGTITDLQFSDDRMIMMTCSRDQTIKLWQLADFEIFKEFKTDRPLNSVSLSPLCFAKDPKARRYHILAGGGQEAIDVTTQGGTGKFELVLLHVVSEEDLGTIRGHFGPMNYVRFIPDGRGFATGGEDGYVRLHFFDPDYFNPKKWD
jgi:translation initiation factor 3 subunit I